MNSINKIKEQITAKKNVAMQKYSQKGLANELGISEGQLSNILAGRRKASNEIINKIENILNKDFYKIGKN